MKPDMQIQILGNGQQGTLSRSIHSVTQSAPPPPSPAPSLGLSTLSPYVPGVGFCEADLPYLVAICAQGAEPGFFLSQLAISSLKPGLKLQNNHLQTLSNQYSLTSTVSTFSFNVISGTILVSTRDILILLDVTRSTKKIFITFIIHVTRETLSLKN